MEIDNNNEKVSAIINQVNELLLNCNTLLCQNKLIENSEKEYGFYLIPIPSSDNCKYYAVRYKDFTTNKWLPTKTSTGTSDIEIARAFAISNRDKIIKKYKEKKRVKPKTDDKSFFKMLEEYYKIGSIYLQDDKVNNQRDITPNQRDKCKSFIRNYLIPYFEEKKIFSIQEVSKTVYSGLKLYLKKSISIKSLNNYLSIFNRILKYHERNDLIDRIPYSKGTGMIKLTDEEKENQRKPNILPVDKLKGLFQEYFVLDGKLEKQIKDSFNMYIISLLGLTTGARPKEIGNIRKRDIVYIKSEDTYILIIYNSKIEYFTTDSERIRKIPLHPYVIKMLNLYFSMFGDNKTDYLFGTPSIENETGNTIGILHSRKRRRAVLKLYKMIKMKEIKEDVTVINKIHQVNDKEYIKEMNKKIIVFYSLRHTFNTLCMLYRHNDDNTERNDDLIDYFMGHKISNSMRANYAHINSVDNKTFMNSYGKFLLDVLDKYIFDNFDEKQIINKDYIDVFALLVKKYKPNLLENGELRVKEIIHDWK